MIIRSLDRRIPYTKTIERSTLEKLLISFPLEKTSVDLLFKPPEPTPLNFFPQILQLDQSILPRLTVLDENPYRQYEDKRHPLYVRARELMGLVFTSELLGEVRAREFHAHAPVIAVSDKAVAKVNKVSKEPGIAWYLGWCDTVLLSEHFPTQADSDKTTAHELFHRAAGFGGGLNRPNSWMHEGLTEYFAQTHVRRLGTSPTYISYLENVVCAAYVRSVVGDDNLLMAAYLSGDFREVVARVDCIHGETTFNSWMADAKVDSLFALLKERGFVGQVCAQDPIAQEALSQHVLFERLRAMSYVFLEYFAKTQALDAQFLSTGFAQP